MTFSAYERRVRVDQSTKLVPAHKAFQFPGGEAHINVEPTASVQVAFVQGADGNDLMKLAMWADAVRHSSRSVLVLPYLPGARQDRGRPLGARVYANFINSLNIDHVVALDPHSDVAPALYDRLTVVSLADLPVWSANVGRYDGIVVPDIGARKRAESVAARLNVPLFQATKHRDFATGKLSGFACEPLDENGKYLVVDDICDGGGTFLGLADVTQLPREQLHLWVTHGIFSQGIGKLSEKFGWIATTDSHEGAYLLPYVNGVMVLPTLMNLVNAVKGL